MICVVCGDLLTGMQKKYCSKRCERKMYKIRHPEIIKECKARWKKRENGKRSQHKSYMKAKENITYIMSARERSNRRDKTEKRKAYNRKKESKRRQKKMFLSTLNAIEKIGEMT